MKKAGEIGLADDIDDFMKMHIDSMEKGDPKLGFGRTDIDESLWANIHRKRQRIKRGSGERMRKKGEKGAPTAAQMKRAKGEQTEAYDIGHDYADYAAKITPGQPQFDPNFQGGEYKPSELKNNLKRVITSFKDYKDNEVKEKDVKEWSMSDQTIDKYKERYGDEWKSKVDEDKIKMMSFKDYVKF